MDEPNQFVFPKGAPGWTHPTEWKNGPLIYRVVRHMHGLCSRCKQNYTSWLLVSENSLVCQDCQHREALIDLNNLRQQVDALARHILENEPREPSQNEGAIETAIRLLQKKNQALDQRDRKITELAKHIAEQNRTILAQGRLLDEIDEALGKPGRGRLVYFVKGLEMLRKRFNDLVPDIVPSLIAFNQAFGRYMEAERRDGWELSKLEQAEARGNNISAHTFTVNKAKKKDGDFGLIQIDWGEPGPR